MATAIQPANQMVQARKDVRALLSSGSYMDQIKQAVPAHLSATVLVRVATTTIQKTPGLLECTQESLLGSIIECAQLGLVPDGILGQAYLVPYKDDKNNRRLAQLQIGYRGLIELARRSGQVAFVVAEPVYTVDEFKVEYAPDRTLRHIPALEDETRGTFPTTGAKRFIPLGFRGAYALVKYKTGEIDFEYLPLHKIEQIRANAKAGSNPSAPWMNHWVEMARKSAIRALGKRLPLSVEFMKASNLDDLHEQGLATDDARVHLSDTILTDLAQNKAVELADKYAPKPQAERECESEGDTATPPTKTHGSPSGSSGIVTEKGAPAEFHNSEQTYGEDGGERHPSEASETAANQQPSLGADFHPFGETAPAPSHTNGARRSR